MENEVTEKVTTQVSEPTQVVKTTTQVNPGVKPEHPQRVFDKKKRIFRFNQVVWYILVFIEVLLVFRIVFKMVGANPASGFVSLIYSITDLMVVPFQGIIGTYTNAGAYFDWAAIIAGIVYALVASGLVYLLNFIKPVTPREVEEQVG